LQAVTISRELGVSVELSEGITPQDKLIVNPPDSLAEGDIVNVIADKPTAQPAKGKAS
jgi:hypothetical protein